ncbi:MAG: hypothetical protein AAF715_26590 [Myxococcota bacterium]
MIEFILYTANKIATGNYYALCLLYRDEEPEEGWPPAVVLYPTAHKLQVLKEIECGRLDDDHRYYLWAPDEVREHIDSREGFPPDLVPNPLAFDERARKFLASFLDSGGSRAVELASVALARELEGHADDFTFAKSDPFVVFATDNTERDAIDDLTTCASDAVLKKLQVAGLL